MATPPRQVHRRSAGFLLGMALITLGANFVWISYDNVLLPTLVERSTMEYRGLITGLIGCVGTLATTKVEDLDRLYATNVRGVFNMSKAFLPSMQTRKHGVVINLASIGGVQGVRDRVAYCATKFAVVGLTKAMALDHAKEGIRVNAICPGRVNTPFVQELLQEYPDPQQAQEDLAAVHAMGRMGKPEEIADAVVFLASPRSSYVTGQVLAVNGGMYM